MKKLTIAFAALLLTTTAVFAGDSNETTISTRVRSSFEKDFARAENATWDKKDGVYYVSFDVNQKRNEAAYTPAGELLAVSKVILRTEMPATVLRSVEQKFAGYNFSPTATEITYEGETNYYMTVANEKHTLKLKIDTYGDITVERRIKK
ncbi:MAG TPA: hypothetical protein PKC39_06720 [Ferruginibacter sp.]|nr:hypothetical protein [Ferruginibacter sp.]HMP20632.1 hypothetical protein [Ferruginibacter sp.]